MKLSPTEYAKHNGQKCPVCKSTDLDVDDASRRWADVYCESCGSNWTEQLKPVQYYDLTVSEEGEEILKNQVDTDLSSL